ncbi:hypothetical protein DH86_00001297, partial [Scytalidium sp. 3C]
KGELKEYITSGISKSEFLSRIGNVLQVTHAPSSLPDVEDVRRPSAVSLDLSRESNRVLSTAENTASSLPGDPGSSNLVPTAEGQAQPQQDTKNNGSDRGMEDGEHVTENKEDVEEAATGEVVQKHTSNVDTNSGPEHASIEKRRLNEAKEERLRILKRVQDDKIERKARETQRRAEANLKQNAHPPSGSGSEITSNPQEPTKTKSQYCALQIRLFDGQTIRSRFPAAGSLRADVRPWIDTQLEDHDHAYTFKQVLTPTANKDITVSEEEKSLASLGLYPNATLILVPVKGYVSAFESDSIGGLVTGTFSTVYSLFSSAVNLATGLVGRLPGRTEIPQAHGASETPDVVNRAPTRGNIRTMEERQPSLEDQQLYNGNALNFEPRRDSQEHKRD